MPQFRYRAVDDHNRPSEGALDANDAREVVQHLERQGLQVSSVEPIEWRKPLLGRSRLTAEDLDLFNDQLSAVVRSGLPMAPSLAVLAQDVQNRRLRRIIEEIHSDLEAGRSLDDALDRHPESFSPVYRSLIRAGEKSGNLSHALGVLATHSSRGIELKNRIQEAVAYPILVMVAAVALLFYFIPNSVQALDLSVVTGGQPVRGVAGLLLTVNGFLSRYSVAVLLAIAVTLLFCSVGWVLLGRSPAGRFIRDDIKTRVPLFGSLWANLALARFTRSLTMLVAGRIPLPDSLRLAGAAAGNARLEAAANQAAASVEAGRNLGDSLSATQYFRLTYCWLVRTGEERNQLEYTLRDLSDKLEEAAEERSRWVAYVLGPLMTVVAAVMVGAAVIGVYMPYIRSVL